MGVGDVGLDWDSGLCLSEDWRSGCRDFGANVLCSGGIYGLGMVRFLGVSVSEIGGWGSCLLGEARR